MDIYSLRDFDEHELVLFGRDPAAGLRAVIAIHSTARGPAAGGCRMWPYGSTEDAVTDALRLSRGMSYKNALADLPFGGGKAVIIADPRFAKTPQLFEAYGRLVESLGGRYITAEDVGTTMEDMGSVARATRHVSGLTPRKGAAGGDPAPKTALGVFLGIKAAVQFRMGRTDLEGMTVAVQGIGGVGYHLCKLLAAEGVQLRVADVRDAALDRVRDEMNTTVVRAESIISEDVDVFAPCALGAILNSDSIPRLRARIVAGAANNQLAGDADGIALAQAGVLYAPDYVVNAGGIISVAREHSGGTSDVQVTAEIYGIAARLTEIFERARHEMRPTSVVADQMARERLGVAARRKVA